MNLKQVLTATLIFTTSIAKSLEQIGDEAQEGITQLFPVRAGVNSTLVDGRNASNVGRSGYRDHDHPEAPKYQPRKIGRYLEWILSDLRKYVPPSGFDYREFEDEMEEIKRHLADVEFAAETESNYPIFKDRLEFVRGIFQTMVDTADKLKRYARFDISSYNLLAEMIELNVRALSLFNARGEIESRIPGLDDHVSLLINYTRQCLQQFRHSIGIPVGIRMMFQTTSDHVKADLSSLVRQLPGRNQYAVSYERTS